VARCSKSFEVILPFFVTSDISKVTFRCKATIKSSAKQGSLKRADLSREGPETGELICLFQVSIAGSKSGPPRRGLGIVFELSGGFGKDGFVKFCTRAPSIPSRLLRRKAVESLET